MTDIRHDYPEYEDERAQVDDQRELQERLERILRKLVDDDSPRRLTADEIKTLCAACGIDVRNVT